MIENRIRIKSLRYKIALLVLVAAILTGALGYAIQRLIVLPSFVSLERQSARKDLFRCMSAIRREIHHLDSVCHNWSAWDETYQFVLTRDSGFVERNLGPSTFQTNSLNLVYICDTRGRVIWGRILDRVTEEYLQIPGFPTGEIPENHILLDYPKSGKALSAMGLSGIYMTSRGPMLIATRPILTTRNEGPIRGSLIMGRFLDDTLLQILCDQTHVNLRIWPVLSESLLPTEQRALQAIRSNSEPFFVEPSSGMLCAYSTFPDIQNNPALLLRADIPREITAAGRTAIRYALYSLLLASITVMLALLLGLRMIVIKPIENLTSQVNNVSAKNDHPVRLSLPRDDEIGDLAREFDLLVNRLSDARETLVTQFQQSQKMEAVGRLAGGVAHDFNNLLTAIQGYTEILLSNFGTPEQANKRLVEIKKAADRAVGLTRQLLSFSRRHEAQVRILDLNTIVHEMENMLCRLIGEDIELAIYPDPAIGKIRADEGQIEQIIMNLAVNARDAMPQGGRLTIETGSADSSESLSGTMVAGRFVTLTVTDTGLGMDETTLARIFEPFFTTKEKGKGTGLGLSTVDELVQKNKGTIQVSSRTGKGTRFRIYLPEVKEEAAETTFDSILTVPLSGTETILVVEDDAIVQELVRTMLQGRGYLVLNAGNGNEALEILKSSDQTIHLLLTDVIMPGINGYDLANQAHALKPEMRIIYMSGYPIEEIRGRGDPSRPDGIMLRKPFSQEVLLTKVREVLDEAKQLSSQAARH